MVDIVIKSPIHTALLRGVHNFMPRHLCVKSANTVTYYRNVRKNIAFTMGKLKDNKSFSRPFIYLTCHALSSRPSFICPYHRRRNNAALAMKDLRPESTSLRRATSGHMCLPR